MDQGRNYRENWKMLRDKSKYKHKIAKFMGHRESSDNEEMCSYKSLY